MDEKDLEWGSVSDFRPGIVQRTVNQIQVFGGAGNPMPLTPSGPNGSASYTGTFGCYALPTGELAPLPQQDYTFNIAFNPGFTCPIVFQTGMVVSSQGASGQVVVDVGQFTANPPVSLYAGYIFANPGSNLAHHKAFRWAIFHGNNSTTAGVTLQLAAANGAAGQTTSSGVYWMGGLMEAVANTPPPIRDFWFYSEDGDGGVVLNGQAETLGSGVTGQLMCIHQARQASLKALPGQTVTSGGGDVYLAVNEAVQFSDPPGTVAGPNTAYFQTDVPYGYGVMSSQSSSDLFMVKHHGGGILVQGDLNSPIVTRLPNVASTRGATMYGCNSPLGFIYGQNHGGVYSWGGGDSTQLLSPQLQDGFWIPPTWVANGTAFTISPYRGSFASWKDWVITPNGWLYDTLTGGWWLLQSTAGTLCSDFQVDPTTGRLFGALPSCTIINNTLQPMILGWNPVLPGTSYQWTSNPLWMMADQPYRWGECREIILEVVGAGSVTVAWQTDQTGGAYVNPTTVTLSNTDATVTNPARVRLNVPQTPTPVRGSWVSFQIQVGGFLSAAPIIRSIQWGSAEATHLKAY